VSGGEKGRWKIVEGEEILLLQERELERGGGKK
jgi:hypothetical protein